MWYKAQNGFWYLTGSQFFNEETFSHSYQRGDIFPDGKAQANIEEQSGLDKLLNDHLSARRYRCRPFIYWQNAQDAMAV